jgi:CMP-N,N'-diacetyllegionaminic acid synthase
VSQGSLRILAVITARGGSKRLPRKNVLLLAGRPLIAWTLAPALRCKDLLHDVVVSTDDPEIAEVARAWGGSVPFMRPPDLASDTSNSLSVVQHATSFMEKRDGVTFDWVFTLQPTSPFRAEEDLRGAVELASRGDCDSVVGMTEAALHPVFAKRILPDGLVAPFVLEEPEGLRRQDVDPPAYQRNGALYLTRREVLVAGGSLYGPRSRAWLMPPERSLDIDTPLDWQLAEVLAAGSEPQGPLAHVGGRT